MDMNVNEIVKAAKKNKHLRLRQVTDLASLDALIKESEIDTGQPGRLLFVRTSWQRCYHVKLVAGGYEVRLCDAQGTKAAASFLCVARMMDELVRCDLRALRLDR